MVSISLYGNPPENQESFCVLGSPILDVNLLLDAVYTRELGKAKGQDIYSGYLLVVHS